MNRLLTAVLLVTSLHVLADDLIEFQDGDVIRAEDFNHNFEELEADIANIPAGPAGPTGPTIFSIKTKPCTWLCFSG